MEADGSRIAAVLGDMAERVCLKHVGVKCREGGVDERLDGPVEGQEGGDAGRGED